PASHKRVDTSMAKPTQAIILYPLTWMRIGLHMLCLHPALLDWGAQSLHHRVSSCGSWSSYTSDSESVVDSRNEAEGCPLRFGLLRNTPHWGNVVSTRPSALFGFAYLTACQWTPAFASPPCLFTG